MFFAVPILSRVPFPGVNKVKKQHSRSGWATIRTTTTTVSGGSMVSTLVIDSTLRGGGDTDYYPQVRATPGPYADDGLAEFSRRSTSIHAIRRANI